MLRTGPPAHPMPSLQPRSSPSPTLPEVCLRTIEFDTRREHDHRTRATSTTEGTLGHDEHELLGWVSPAPSRAVAHLMIILQEIRCTQCRSKRKQTIKFFKPTRNNIIRFRNTKTCRRRAGGTLHLTAAIHRVGILTVFSGEDTMQ